MFKYLSVFCFILVSSVFYSQESIGIKSYYREFAKAEDLFLKGKYSIARNEFQKLHLKYCSDQAIYQSNMCLEAEYYITLINLKLFNNNAQLTAEAFIEEHPNYIRTQFLLYNLGGYYFRKKKYKKAYAHYSKVEGDKLKKELSLEVDFKRAYCKYILSDYDKASLLFFSLKEKSDNKYKDIAVYYYAHIAYSNKQYQTALENFKKIIDSRNFKHVVPYYITQIYYFQEKYKELVGIAPKLIDIQNTKRTDAIYKMLGDAYYYLENYDSTIYYLEESKRIGSGKFSDQTFFELGYSYFKEKDYASSIPYLKRVTRSEDHYIRQVAFYYLSSAYLKVEKKRFAQNTFRLSANIDNADKDIQENALFNYAQLAYELSNYPFNDAIDGFQEFIREFPKSSKIQEAYTFLASAYYSANNYDAALYSLEKVEEMNFQQKKAYQKIAHYYGVELIDNGSNLEAISYFEKSKKYPIDLNLDAYSDYWIGECYFKIGNFKKSVDYYQKSLYNIKASELDIYVNTYYHIAYSYFFDKNYVEAISWFRKYIKLASKKKKLSKVVNDSYNRLGDSYFMLKNYLLATNFYDKAFSMGAFDRDYSMYQSAICYGIIGKYQKKIDLLKKVLHGLERSNYKDDALYSLSETEVLINKPEEALKHLQEFIKRYPKSIFYSKVLSKIGLIKFNQKKDEEALSYFSQIFSKFPNSREAVESLQHIKRIFLEKNDLETFQEFLVENNVPDSLELIKEVDYYEVAEQNYFSKEYKKATIGFTDYIEKYSQGVYLLDAYYKRGVSQYKLNYYEEALVDFKKVIEFPKNKYTEDALLMGAKSNKEIGDKEEELKIYKNIIDLSDIPSNIELAMFKLLHLKKELNQIDSSFYLICDSVISISERKKKYFEASDARLVKIKATLEQGDTNESVISLKKILNYPANKNVAEAGYLYALVLRNSQLLDSSNNVVFDIIGKYSNYPLWVNKSLLLLAKNYYDLKDTFQSKVTLKSIIEKSSFPEVVKEAIDNLTDIEAKEAAKSDLPTENELIDEE